MNILSDFKNLIFPLPECVDCDAAYPSTSIRSPLEMQLGAAFVPFPRHLEPYCDWGKQNRTA